MENQSIRVTGKGVVRVRPDTTRLTLSLSGLCPEYSDALQQSARDTEALKVALRPLGFADTELKTTQFSVDTEYEGYQDEQGRWQNRFAGYRWQHALKLEFPSDRERLGHILFALGSSPARPELHIGYTVRDPEAVKNELLGKAVADAKAKAAVLAAAAGVKLCELLSVDYAWGQPELEVRPMRKAVMMDARTGASGANSFDPGIEPEDIETSDTVTLVWRIE